MLALFGPTASGKSELALAVARRRPSEIVIADSMQLYRGLPILTAQPAAHEQELVPHHLVGLWELTDEGSVGAYAPRAHVAIDAVRARGALPLIVGGTGLYLRAALVELRLPPPVAPALRESLDATYEEIGGAAMLVRLAEQDPRAAERLHANDRRRVVRALELASVGRSLAPEHDRLWSDDLRVPAAIVVLEWPREALEARIRARARAMLAGGAVDEVRDVIRAGVRLSTTASRILGLGELLAVAEGRMSLSACEDEIVLRTRQYARRQETWARKIRGAVVLAGSQGAERNADELLALLDV